MVKYAQIVVFCAWSMLASIGLCSDPQVLESPLYPYQSSIELQDEFTSGTGVTGFVGNLGWGVGNGTTSILTSEVNRPGIYRRDTSAVSGTITTTNLYPHSSANFAANLPHRVVFIVRLNNNDADTLLRVGIGNSTAGNPPGTGIYFEKANADTNWFCVTESGGVTRTDSGVAVNTSFNTFEYRRLSASVEFYLNGSRVCTNTTNLSSSLSNPFVQIINNAAASKTVDIDYFQLQLSGLTR